jgi:cellulose synthase (UDP-forming)
MGPRQKSFFALLIGVWLLSASLFFLWWMQAEHIVGWTKFTINTLLLMWTMVLPGYFFFFVSRMKRVNPKIEIPKDWRIAMIITRTPSEPFSIARKNLQAMLAQKIPHDTWLADEDPTEEVRQWCDAHGVRLISRKGIQEYHNQSWPRRTKCKEGNLAYFYDTYGYDFYDFMVQLDTDHIPQEGYLENILKPFVNEEVGCVGT